MLDALLQANMTFPHGAAYGPTSLLLRFNTADEHIGPSADDFFGYECALNPGSAPPVASLGYHAHMYTAMESGPAADVPAGRSFVFRVELDATRAGLAFEYFVDGKSQAKWTDADEGHAKAVSGVGVGVRAFDGAVVFHSLSFGM